MEHPIVHAPGDPFVERVRAMAVRYPEATEVFSHGRPVFKAGASGKVFVRIGSMMEIPHSITFTPDPLERQTWLNDPRVWSPPYDGPSGKLAFDAGVGDEDVDAADWTLIAELIDTSFRQVALRRQLRALESLNLP